MSAKITCAGCGKQFSWKPELAGKKGKCKCGQTVSFPLTDPADALASAPEPDIFQIDDDAPPPPRSKPAAPRPVAAPGAPACPSCSAPLAETAVICIQCGYNRKTGKTISAAVVVADPDPAAAQSANTAGAPTAAEDQAEASRSIIDTKRDVILPAALLAIGVAIEVGAALHEQGSEAAGEAITLVAIRTAIGVAMFIIAAFITAKLLDLDMGDLRTAALKFAAVSTFPAAAASALVALAGTDYGLFIEFPVVIGGTYGLIMWLFSLDVFETIVLTVINGVIQRFALAFILAMILHSSPSA